MNDKVLSKPSKSNAKSHNENYKNILLEMLIADFAVDLIVFRKKFELTQSELALMMELPEDMIVKLEKGYM